MNLDEAVSIKKKHEAELNEAKAALLDLDKRYLTASAKDVDKLSTLRVQMETRRDIAAANVRAMDAELTQLKTDSSAPTKKKK